jgi:hypothetical protein
LRRSVFVADSIASSSGLAPTSGNTRSERDMAYLDGVSAASPNCTWYRSA